MISRLYAGNIQPDAVHAGAGGNVQCFAVTVAPGDIAYPLGNFDGSQVFAFGRNDPDATRTRAIEISRFIHAYTVRSARRFVRGGIEKQSSCADRSVGLDGVAQPDVFSRFRYVQEFLVRRKCYAVRAAEILDDKLEPAPRRQCARLLLARFRDAVDAVRLELLFRVAVALGRQPVRRIGE